MEVAGLPKVVWILFVITEFLLPVLYQAVESFKLNLTSLAHYKTAVLRFCSDIRGVNGRKEDRFEVFL